MSRVPSSPAVSTPAGSAGGAQLTAAGLSLRRGGRTLVSELTLTVDAATRLAIVGENGRGKSTLLAALAGDFEPDTGTVSRHGRIAVAAQEMPLAEGATVGTAVAFAIRDSLAALDALDRAAEALAEAGASPETATAVETRYATALDTATHLDAWDAERRVTQALEALDAETNLARPLAELSVGQRYRVRLACVLAGDAEILLLDEPTNHLDARGLAALTDALRERGGGYALVSHDRQLLRDCAESFLDLDPAPDGRAQRFSGGYAEFRAAKLAARASWEQRYAAQQAELAQAAADLAAAQARLSTGWRPEKGTGKHQRASRAPAIVQSVRRRQAALDTAAIPLPEPPLALAAPRALVRASGPLLLADGVSLAPRLGTRVSCALAAGERLLVRGPNGAGKSTLLGILAGQLTPATGGVRLHPEARRELLAQEESFSGGRSAAEVFRARLGLLRSRGVLPEAGDGPATLTELGLLTARESQVPVAELSVGQQRRLALALCLVARPDVLLLDEPSNHLSLTLVEELTEALAASAAAIVVSTHDRALLADLASWPTLTL